jgi:hypothetical protein
LRSVAKIIRSSLRIIEKSPLPVFVSFKTEITDEIGFLCFDTMIFRRNKSGKVKKYRIPRKRDLWLVCNTGQEGYKVFNLDNLGLRSPWDVYNALYERATDGPIAVLFHPEGTDIFLLVIIKSFTIKDLDHICYCEDDDEEESEELADEDRVVFCGVEEDPEDRHPDDFDEE